MRVQVATLAVFQRTGKTAAGTNWKAGKTVRIQSIRSVVDDSEIR